MEEKQNYHYVNLGYKTFSLIEGFSIKCRDKNQFDNFRENWVFIHMPFHGVLCGVCTQENGKNLRHLLTNIKINTFLKFLSLRLGVHDSSII